MPDSTSKHTHPSPVYSSQPEPTSPYKVAFSFSSGTGLFTINEVGFPLWDVQTRDEVHCFLSIHRAYFRNQEHVAFVWGGNVLEMYSLCLRGKCFSSMQLCSRGKCFGNVQPFFEGEMFWQHVAFLQGENVVGKSYIFTRVSYSIFYLPSVCKNVSFCCTFPS